MKAIKQKPHDLAGHVKSLISTLNCDILVFLTIFAPLVAAGDGGDEFSNNLFSDLAPLLALFGERVATQYLSHSTHWLDNVIFACAPLGILTAITSAIRVGGSRNLKSIIGRAKESDAQAEIELVSSTSSDVCELWNGTGLVRVVGSPDILEFIWGKKKGNSNLYVLGAKEDEENMILLRKELGDSSVVNKPAIPHDAPNISLNTIGGSAPLLELYTVTAIGLVLQAGVLVFEGLATYHWRWLKGGRPVATYAFPLTFLGTLGLFFGMYICAHIIEGTTIEETKEAQEGAKVIWLQKGQTVGDQTFKSFAIYAPKAKGETKVIVSRRRKEIDFYEGVTATGACLSVVAFILQFVGLRAMHFSASIAQLVGIIIMTLLRVMIRRHLSQ
ncbi:hypothetical protein DFH27DRAFT_486975, partial [Peziza echinospora]